MEPLNKLAFFLICFCAPLYAQPYDKEDSSPSTQAYEDQTSPQIQRLLEIEWEEVPGTQIYEIRLTPEGGGEALSFETTETSFQKMIPADIYLFQIRSRNQHGDRSPWTQAIPVEVIPNKVVLLSPQADEVLVQNQPDRFQKIKFTWSKAKNAQTYLLTVWTEEGKKSRSFKTKDTERSLTLAVGYKYFWKIDVTGESGILYENSSPTQSFFIIGQQLPPPELTQLEITKHIQLNWEPVAKAETYSATLGYRPLLGKSWDPIDKAQLSQAYWKFSRPLRAGEYRIQVLARSSRHVDSLRAEKRFLVKPSKAEVEDSFNSQLN